MTTTMEAVDDKVGASYEPSRDEEGLLQKYDVVVCGTGLVQSILASALARAGKTVLHCDGQGHYGELDTVWTFPYFQSHMQQDLAKTGESTDVASNAIPLSPVGACDSLKVHSMHTSTNFSAKEVGVQVLTPFGTGTVVSLPDTSSECPALAVSLQNWTMANAKSPVVYLGVPRDGLQDLDLYLEQVHSVIPSKKQQANFILEKHSRSLALDANPGLVYASGSATEGLVQSGVAEYLDFKCIEALFWLQDGRLSRVPCSKGDVFSTKLLAPMDKRRFMKFLQLTMDYAAAVKAAEEKEDIAAEPSKDAVANQEGEEEVKSLNERHLNQGRALARPQNKAVATDDLKALQTCIEGGMTFNTYLEEKQKLSPKLRSLVRYALVLDTTPVGDQSQQELSLEASMKSLCRHLQALGRFGTTAFLVPMYGSGELSQAFCRSAAVHGATYLLRRGPSQVLLSTDNAVEAVVLEGETSDDKKVGNCSKPKKIPCKYVVTSAESLMKPSNTRTLRWISIFCGRLIQSDDGAQRHVIIIPPNAFGNPFSIHGVVLDDSICVAPSVGSGCTILHLTTTIHTEGEVDDSILEKAATAIRNSCKEAGGSPVDEIFHTSFSFAHCDEAEIPVADNLILCRHSHQCLTVDAAFDQANKLFSKICPDVEFLHLSEGMDKTLKENLGDRLDEDEERRMLESAMEMVTTAAEPERAHENNPESTQETNE